MHISPIDLNHWSFYCFPHYHSFHFFTLTFPRVPSWKKSYFWWCCQLLNLSCWQKNKSRRHQRLFCPDDPPSPWRTWPRRGWRQQRWLISGRIDGNFFKETEQWMTWWRRCRCIRGNVGEQKTSTVTTNSSFQLPRKEQDHVSRILF